MMVPSGAGRDVHDRGMFECMSVNCLIAVCVERPTRLSEGPTTVDSINRGLNTVFIRYNVQYK